MQDVDKHIKVLIRFRDVYGKAARIEDLLPVAKVLPRRFMLAALARWGAFMAGNDPTHSAFQKEMCSKLISRTVAEKINVSRRGQLTQEEKSLGKQIQSLVAELTPFEPYFAEYQSSLEGLTDNIFRSLDQAVGFITVMHSRGEVTIPDRKIMRASVWVEQEIAIAAFLVQTLGRKLHAVAFIQDGIHLEGVRKYIIFKPEPFKESAEVIQRLKAILPTWNVLERKRKGTHLAPRFEWPKNNRPTKSTQKRHDYELVVAVKNDGTKKVRELRTDIWVPRELTDETAKIGTEFEGSKTHRFFSDTIEAELFPGDLIRVARIPYFVDSRILDERYQALKLPAIVKIFSDGMDVQTIEETFEGHHCF